jgi:hypothetical protein
MHEDHYLTHDLELATMVHALKIWRHYHTGKRYESYTDHKSLKYIFTQPDLNLRQRRYLELIKDYNIGINCRTREAIMVVDIWSQRSPVSQLVAKDMSFELFKKFDKLNLRIVANT